MRNIEKVNEVNRRNILNQANIASICFILPQKVLIPLQLRQKTRQGMQSIDGRNNNLLILNTSHHLFFKSVVNWRLQHILHMILIDTDVLDVEEDGAAVVLQRDKTTPHLLVR